MNFSKLKEVEKKNKHQALSEKLYKGACVKIKNSQKIFQVVGFNPKSKVCWIRKWPFSLEENKTFSLEINQLTEQTFCSQSISKTTNS